MLLSEVKILSVCVLVATSTLYCLLSEWDVEAKSLEAIIITQIHNQSLKKIGILETRTEYYQSVPHFNYWHNLLADSKKAPQNVGIFYLAYHFTLLRIRLESTLPHFKLNLPLLIDPPFYGSILKTAPLLVRV